ncbi:MAG TPA: hypothetical protein VFO18_00405 [Methylomirabilota bacterium]|nr:hypothetical protein [Methylomirabilota bacterium]
MRLGCLGCLVLVIFIILATVLGVAGVLFMSGNIYGTPDFIPTPFSRSDGFAAQQKLFEVVQRESGRSSRQDPIVLTDREVTAFLARHLEQNAGLPLSPLGARFLKREMLIQGRTPLRNLLQGPPFAQLVPFLPEERMNQPVWVTVRGRISVESGLGGGAARYAKFVVSDFALGKQPVSSWLLTIMMGPSSVYLLRWQVPPNVESVDIDEGQVVIRTR